MATEAESLDVNLAIRLQVIDPTALTAFTMTPFEDERTGEVVLPQAIGGQEQEVHTALARMLLAAFERFGSEAGLRFHGFTTPTGTGGDDGAAAGGS